MDKATNKQVGVVSFGIGCGRADYSGVLARVSGAADWINENVCLMSRTPPATCYPYLVQWGNDGCVGVMIAADIVLTGGQCGHWDTDPLYHNIITFPSFPGLYRSVVARVVHPGYQYYVRDYDIQLLKLEQSALTDKDGQATGVAVVPIYRETKIPDSLLTEVAILGEETTADSFNPHKGEKTLGEAPNLQQVSLTSLSDDSCPISNMLDKERMVCTGVVEGGDNPQAQTCNARGGSPILDANGAVVSIASWGKDCDKPQVGGASAKLSSSADWIDKTACDLSDYEISGDIRCSNSGHSPTLELNGKGTFTVTVKHDKYSSEVSWRVTHPETYTQMYYQPYQSTHEPEVLVIETFEHLPAGTYQLEIADLESE